MASSKFALFSMLLLIPGFVSAQGSSMGLLFTSPEERAYLDYLREDFLERTASQGFDIQTEEIPEIETPETEQNVEFRLDAVITNQDGSHTIWLNGSPVRERNLPQDVALVHRSGQDHLQISTSSATYWLKPGQTVDLSSGQLWESFESRPAISEGEQSAANSGAAQVTSTNISGPPSGAPGSQSQQQLQGVVAIQDLIEALQMIQSGSNEEESESTQ